MKTERFYAQVLCDVAGQSGMPALDQVVSELEKVSAALTESPLMMKVFQDPTVTENERAAILKTLKDKMGLGEFTLRYLLIMSKRGRVGILPGILEEVAVIATERSGGVIGELTTAEVLDSATVLSVANTLGKKLNKKVLLKQKIDPSLIAGMRVSVSGMTYDGSVRAQLNRAQEAFRKRLKIF